MISEDNPSDTNKFPSKEEIPSPSRNNKLMPKPEEDLKAEVKERPKSSIKILKVIKHDVDVDVEKLKDNKKVFKEKGI